MQKVHAFVTRVQAQPLETRKALLLGLSVGITAVIALLWVLGFILWNRNGGPQENANKAVSAVPDSESPFKIIGDSAVEVYANAVQGYQSAFKK